MITLEEQGPVAVVRLASGKVNALDVELLDELSDALAGLKPGDVGAVVLTGEGRAFSAGVDLRRYVDGGPAYVDQLVPALARAFETLFTLPVPTVAAVNGAAIAGGCILAAACDRRLIAAGAPIGATELTVGVAFPVSALEILAHVCGPRVDDVVYGAGLYRDADAVAVGLANEVVAGDDLLAAAVALATALAAYNPPAFRLAKEQRQRAAVARMRADAPTADALVREVWAAPAAVEAARAVLDGVGRR